MQRQQPPQFTVTIPANGGWCCNYPCDQADGKASSSDNSADLQRTCGIRAVGRQARSRTTGKATTPAASPRTGSPSCCSSSGFRQVRARPERSAVAVIAVRVEALARDGAASDYLVSVMGPSFSHGRI
jgi:hypothetical protein